MASSQHRPGAKVSLSAASYATEQLKRVENLETQLEQLPPKKSDDQASRLRMRLCEIVSDIILTDPLFALKNDCIGRLWRSCFYGPIGTLRSRISREKRKKGPNVAKLEKSLSHFLTEAITLYEYLISQYHGKLLPDASMTPNSQDSSQNSMGDSQQPPPSTNPAGVVPGLFRMYIHMGDLYRYESSYHKAQLYYYNASKLSPGRGNPYNQLAVVAQLKDTAAPLNAVALFWYARSLLTTHEPFEISKANLARLFQSNRDWFHNQAPPTEDALKPANNGNGGRDMVKAQRTVASRHFLSQFVDLHYSFFQGVKSDGASGAQTNKSETLLKDNDVVKQMEAILTPCSVLLGASAFGDALLCKLVVICAFSEAYNPASDDESQKKHRDTEILARVFTLSFASCLAEQAVVGLAKIQDQPEKMGNPGKAPPSVRLLLPLLLVCEYVESVPVNMDFDQTSLSRDTRSFCEKTVDTFWQRIGEVMNILTNLRGPLGLSSGQAWDNSCLKEFTNLIGYSPFQGCLDDPRAASRDDGFASIEEAVAVLELTQSSTQESGALQPLTEGCPSGGAQSVEEYKVKVARFLAFGDRMADTNEGFGDGFERTPQGSYMWMNDSDTQMEEVDGNDNPMMAEETMEENGTQPPVAGKDDEGGDVLVYSVPEGGGPALLVPGMMLQHRALTSVSGDKELRNSTAGGNGLIGPPIPGLASALGMSLDNPQPAPATPASVKPPPGFGMGSVAPAATMPLAGMAHQAPLAMDGNLGVSGYAPQMPREHMAGLPLLFSPGFASVMQQQQQQPPFEPTIGTSMHFFGGPEALKTGNPFAAASTPPIDANRNLMLGFNMGAPGAGYPHAASFLNEASGGGGESLFGSGLLSSLFEDASDQRTKNPFAT
jgi:Est1 DNA/RNA binding domain/Telomerase activating protein Est1